MLDHNAIEKIRTTVRGSVIEPQNAAYDEARRVYNAMIDRHPSLIVRCVDVADVIAGVKFRS